MQDNKIEQNTEDQDIPPLTNKQLLAFFAMIIGMFMAILDIQIVASSLPAIAAGLSASADELSWVQTSYLIAEVIIIPVSGFVAKCLSIRIAFFIAAVGFTIMSVFCSIAWSIESMIIFRALQGFFGGAMIPSIFGIAFVIFPPSKRPIVNIIMGLVVTIAPTLGPTIGGYITESLSWHFMFLLNVIPGIFVCVVVFLYADFDKPNYNLLKNFDYIGLALMTIALGSLQYVLEEGNRKGWFEDSLIATLFFISALCFVLLLIRELTCCNPILDFSAFTNRNFVIGCIGSFILGIGLYGVVYVMPLFLFSVARFNTIQIGITMIVTGTAQFCSAPIVGTLAGRGVDLRIILAIGFTLFGTGCYINSFLTPDSRFEAFLIPQILRGMGSIFCFIPINTITLGTIAKDRVQYASGLYNLNRNLGGALGLAAVASSLTANTARFSQYLNENIVYSSPRVIDSLNYFQILIDGRVADPEKAAYLLMSQGVTRDAFILAINNIFITISLLFFMSVLLLPFVKKVTMDSSSNDNAH